MTDFRQFRAAGLALITTSFMAGPAAADIVHGDDVIINDSITGSGDLCVGVDCVSGEGFGSDTIRLKENNVRLHFDDTSTAAGLPTNDWRILINDVLKRASTPPKMYAELKALRTQAKIQGLDNKPNGQMLPRILNLTFRDKRLLRTFAYIR